jgi:hypothetical protein
MPSRTLRGPSPLWFHDGTLIWRQDARLVPVGDLTTFFGPPFHVFDNNSLFHEGSRFSALKHPSRTPTPSRSTSHNFFRLPFPHVQRRLPRITRGVGFRPTNTLFEHLRPSFHYTTLLRPLAAPRFTFLAHKHSSQPHPLISWCHPPTILVATFTRGVVFQPTNTLLGQPLPLVPRCYPPMTFGGSPSTCSMTTSLVK